MTRVIRILETLCDSPTPLSLADLSRILSSPKSSVASLLRGLAEAGYVALIDGAWRLGPGAFGLGSALNGARRRFQSSDLIREGMHRLAERSGETVLFAVADGEGETLTYVDVVESGNAVRFAMAAGDRRPLYATSAGRVLLAALPEAEFADYLRKLKPVRLTKHTLIGKRELAAIVDEVRKTGVAQTVDQATDGVTGTAAAVRDAGGGVAGVLIVAAPGMRVHDGGVSLANQVKAEAEMTSRSLGYRP